MYYALNTSMTIIIFAVNFQIKHNLNIGDATPSRLINGYSRWSYSLASY